MTTDSIRKNTNFTIVINVGIKIYDITQYGSFTAYHPLFKSFTAYRRRLHIQVMRKCLQAAFTIS